MRKLTFAFLLSVAVTFLLSHTVPGQSQGAPAAPGSSQERKLAELVEEVRLLRISMQRTSAAAYRAQITGDRLKIQMDQVARLSRELTEVRDRLSDEQGRQPVLKATLDEMTRQKEAGTRGDGDIRALSFEIEASHRRELQFIERESQISSELASARIEVTDLKTRLDRLESEISTATPKDGQKQQ